MYLLNRRNYVRNLLPGFGDEVIDQYNDYLTSYWKLNDLTDTIGSRTLTNYNSALFNTTGMYDKSVKCTGSEKLLYTANDAPLLYGNFVLNLWCKKLGNASSGSSYGIVVCKDNGLNQLELGFNNDGTFRAANGMSSSIGSWVLGADGWNMVTFIGSGTDMHFYVNGAFQYTKTGWSNDSESYDFVIGGRQESSTYWFNGLVDEMYYWKDIVFSTTNDMSDFVDKLYRNGNGINYKSYKDKVFGNDIDTVLLITGSGDNDDTYQDDLSLGGSDHIIVFNGDAKLESSTSIYSNASIKFNNDDFLTIDDSTDWDFPQNRTIELFSSFQTIQSSSFISQRQDSDNQWNFLIASDNSLWFYIQTNGSMDLSMQSSVLSWNTDQEYHLAVVKNGNNWRMYRDGKVIATGTTSGTITQYTAPLYIGAFDKGDGDTQQDMDGNINHLSVTNNSKYYNDFIIPKSGFYPLSYIFAPSDLNNLELWLDSSTITGLSDGDSVSTWSDQSGNSNDALQTTTSEQPIYKTDIINGKPAIRFDGSADYLRIDSSSNQFDLATPTIFIVTTQGTGSFIGKSDASVSNTSRRKLQLGSSGDYGYSSGPDGTYIATNPGTLSGLNIFMLTTISDSSHIMGVNGSETVFTTTLYDSVFNTKDVALGKSFPDTSVEYYDGDMAEVLIYSNALSETERRLVYIYLSNKYKITLS